MTTLTLAVVVAVALVVALWRERRRSTLSLRVVTLDGIGRVLIVESAALTSEQVRRIRAAFEMAADD